MLADTEAFYTKEAADFIEANVFTTYMERVEMRLNVRCAAFNPHDHDVLQEEQQRVEKYMHASTQARLAKCCEKVFIASHLEQFQSECKTLLRDGKDKELALMFRLCERVDGGLVELQNSLESHVRECGLAAVEQVRD